jgi:hypothetical protein
MAVSGSSSLSIRHSDSSDGSLEPPAQGILNQLLEGELANRFHQMSVTPEQIESIVQMLTLPDGIQPPICPMTGRPYEGIVSPGRLLDIISHVTMFECGVQQLVDLAELCHHNGLRLCFVQCSRYGFDPGNSLNGNHILYVGLPEDRNTIEGYCREAPINIITMKNGQLCIQQVRLLNWMQNNLERTDGYLIGHELSHATAYAKDPSSYGERRDIQPFLNFILQQSHLELTQLQQDSVRAILEGLFQDSEEARNALKLDPAIISEHDFLREQLGPDQQPFKIPQGISNKITWSSPELCATLLKLIFLLKHSGSDITNAKDAFKKALQNDETAFPTVRAINRQLNDCRYTLLPFNLDLSCGLHFIMEQIGLQPTDTMRRPMRFIELSIIANSIHDRRLIVIDATTSTPRWTQYVPKSEVVLWEPEPFIDGFLDNINPESLPSNAIILLKRPGDYWQVVIPPLPMPQAHPQFMRV